MAILKFNKSELVNLSYSLKREIILANRTGAYCNTSIVSCNTRRYHGLLAVPVDNFGKDKHLLLSSLDESLVLGGHQFNLGIHRYDTLYEPRGHKYIVDFSDDRFPEITYKVGAMLFKKEILLAQDSDQVFLRYTLLRSPSPVTLMLKPFLAFRNIHNLTRENDNVRSGCTEVDSGVSFCMYPGFPNLVMQLSTAAEFKYQPYWYKGITYSDEYRRGFDCREDLWVPGVFSLKMKSGDSVVFSASVNADDPKMLKRKFTSCVRKLANVQSYKDILLRNAELLKCNRNGVDQINAGFSWMETGLLRETLETLPGLTLYADGNCTQFESILDNLIKAEQERLFKRTTQIEAPLRIADVLQQYILFGANPMKVWKKYGATVKGIVESYRPGVRREVSLHPNGLLWAQMENVALTWMNAYIDGKPVTERAGYQVDTNAWWYNLLCFAVQMESNWGDADSGFVQEWSRIRDIAGVNFQKVFYNPDWGYLSDYVDNYGMHPEVRPNQMIAAYVQFSPIDDEIQSSVISAVTNELLTRRGIRTLSPRNVMYRGVYEGSQIDRDLAYHQGSTRTSLLGPYFNICFRMMGENFLYKAESLVSGFMEDVSKHGVGAFSELYDGDPPHEPHGAISSATATAALLWCEYMMDNYRKQS